MLELKLSSIINVSTHQRSYASKIDLAALLYVPEEDFWNTVNKT